MQDEPEPPRKVYGFKAREFERANSAPVQPSPETPAPDPGVIAASDEKISVHELIRAGAGPGSQLGFNKVGNRDNDVHDMLRANLARDQADGHFDLGTLDDSKRRRRIRNYWIGIVAINGPLGFLAYRIGHEAALPFVFAIAGMALVTSALTWRTFFLRTHY